MTRFFRPLLFALLFAAGAPAHAAGLNDTGLMWEVKTGDGGLRDAKWTYTWYNSNAAINGG